MKDLVKNPIGIIALFISMIYGFANLLLGATANSLTQGERFPLIIFIVLFPVVVLGVYYLLVSRHHGKLYAPGDYKDDRSFLRTLSSEERERKLDNEAEEALPPAGTTDAASHAVEKAAPKDKSQRMLEIRNEVRLIENFVVSKFESEFNVRADRDVTIGDTGAVFDAVFNASGRLTFLEVKSVRHPGMMASLLDRVLYNAVVADKFMESNFKLVLAVVYHFDEAELARLEAMWRRRIEKCPVAVDIRFIQRAELGA